MGATGSSESSRQEAGQAGLVGASSAHRAAISGATPASDPAALPADYPSDAEAQAVATPSRESPQVELDGHSRANLTTPTAALPSPSVASNPAGFNGDQPRAVACRPIATPLSVSSQTVQGGSCPSGTANDEHIQGDPNASKSWPARLDIGPLETRDGANEAQAPPCAVSEPPAPPARGISPIRGDSKADVEVSPTSLDRHGDCQRGMLAGQTFQADAVAPAHPAGHPARLDESLASSSKSNSTQAQTGVIGSASSAEAFNDDYTTSECAKNASNTEKSSATVEERSRAHVDNFAVELEDGAQNAIDRSSRALASEMEMPELKLAIMRRTSLNRALAALGLSCLFSVAGLTGVVTRLADSCTEGDTDQAASLTFVYLNGIAMTAGGLILLFVTISYPQRVLVRAIRRKWTPLPQQLALIVLIVVLAITPISSIYRVLLYWFNVAQVQSLDEKGECIAAALRADELEFHFVFNGGATIVIGAMLFEWAAVIKLSGYKTLGVIRAMRENSALPRDRLFESMMSGTDDGGEDHEQGETLWCGHAPACFRKCGSCLGPLTLFRKIRAFFSMENTHNIFFGGLPWLLTVAVIGYTVVCVILELVLDFEASFVPIVSLVTVVRVCLTHDSEGKSFCSAEQYPQARKRAIAVVLISLAEAAIFYGLSVIAKRTYSQLRKVPYNANRSNFLAFIYFQTSSVLMWSWVFFFGILEVSIPSARVWIIQYKLDSDLLEVTETVNPFFVVGVGARSSAFGYIYLILVVWLTGVAFAFLPADSEGVSGWFCESGSREQEEVAAEATQADEAGSPPLAPAPRLAPIDHGNSIEPPTKEMRDFLADHPAYMAREESFARFCETRAHERRALVGKKQSSKLARGSSMLDLAVKDTLCAQPSHVIARQVRSPVLVMETELLMFNFASAAYRLARTDASTAEERLKLLAGAVEDPRYAIVDHVFDPVTDTHALIASSDDRVVISFRGTVSGTNARTDLDLALRPYPFASCVEPVASDHPYARASAEKVPKVHAGFVKAYWSISHVIERLVEPLLFDASMGGQRRQRRTLFTTGHSLGGGLAVVCAFEFAANLASITGQRTPAVQCTTFGCPRIGSWSFSQRFRAIVPAARRFVVASDLIPRTPIRFFKAPYSGYFHCGLELLLDLDGNLIVGPNVVENVVVGGGLRGPIKRMHYLSRYCLALLVWCRRRHGAAWDPPVWNRPISMMLTMARSDIRKRDAFIVDGLKELLRREGVVYGDRRSISTQTKSTGVGDDSGVASDTAWLSADHAAKLLVELRSSNLAPDTISELDQLVRSRALQEGGCQPLSTGANSLDMRSCD